MATQKVTSAVAAGIAAVEQSGAQTPRALIVNAKIAWWSASKYDKGVSEQIAAMHGADAKSGRYIKDLLPGDDFESPVLTGDAAKAAKVKVNAGADVVNKANSHKRLVTFLRGVRNWHYRQTMPWTDNGDRIISMAGYGPYIKQFRKFQLEAEGLLAEFRRDYPHLRAKAQVLLNGMFNALDYPAIEEIDSKFKIESDPKTVPVVAHLSGDLRTQLGDEEAARLIKAVEDRTAQGYKDAQAHATRRLFEMLANMHKIFAQKDAAGRAGKVHPSLIEHCRELCQVLDGFNLTGDPELERFRRETELLSMSEAETISSSKEVRAECASRIEDIQKGMLETYGKDFFSCL